MAHVGLRHGKCWRLSVGLLVLAKYYSGYVKNYASIATPSINVLKHLPKLNNGGESGLTLNASAHEATDMTGGHPARTNSPAREGKGPQAQSNHRERQATTLTTRTTWRTRKDNVQQPQDGPSESIGDQSTYPSERPWPAKADHNAYRSPSGQAKDRPSRPAPAPCRGRLGGPPTRPLTHQRLPGME